MLWMKALHVISVIAWMAGLLYLPRLFVYHCDAVAGSVQSETFKVMERRLLRAIMMPAMISSWFFGLGLTFGFGLVDWASGWPWVKAVSVIALTFVHFWYASLYKKFAEDLNFRPARFFRFLNEVPTLLMIIIVVAVIVRPF